MLSFILSKLLWGVFAPGNALVLAVALGALLLRTRRWQRAGRRLVTLAADSSGALIPMIASPFHMSATPVADPRPAPPLGRDLDDVLSGELGYTPDRIASLAAAGAFGRAV